MSDAVTDTDRMLAWLRETLDAAQAAAKATTPVPIAGEWATVRDKHADEDAPLSLIQGQDPHEPDYQGYSSGVPIIAISADWPEAEANLLHIALHDPAAVLRRIAADRQILAEHQVTKILGWAADWVDACVVCGPHRVPCNTVRLLAEGWGWPHGE